MGGAMRATMVSIMIVLIGVGGPLGYRFARRVGGEQAILIALMMLAVAPLIRLFATNAWVFTLSSIVAGIGMAIGTAVVPALLARYVGERKRGTATGL